MLYASPVAYDVTQIPESYQRLFYLINPLAAPIVAFRASLLPTAPMPPLAYLIWSAAVAMAMFVLGAAVFKRTERKFADVV